MARKFLPSLFAVAVLVSLTAVADERTGPVGRMTVTNNGVQWQASGNYDHLVLTVQLPSGENITRDFPGSMATFRLQDLAPYVAGDGLYHFQIIAVPKVSEGVRAQLADAHERGDDAAVATIRAQAGLNDAPAQSGVFTIANGSFVTGDAVEPGTRPEAKPEGNAEAAEGKLGTPSTTSAPAFKPAVNDVVQTQNEEIQASLCVGFDCVSGESFGFDTIKLKENNTRIHFQDTSTSTGFPNVNWQLTANDSNSGGANKFSIDDLTNSKTPFTITAAAPTNSLFVASNGNVGFGNNAPVLNLHITSTNTPALRQEQTSGGGFTAQTWDIGANEANWFVRDVTGGSRLPLRIRPGAPTSSIDISASGNVGMGTASPARALDLQTTLDSAVTARMQNKSATGFEGIEYIDNSGNVDLFIGEDNAGNIARYNSMNSNPHVFYNNGVETMRLTTTGMTVTGNFTATGTKNFAMPDPADPKRAIYFAALEGPEAGTYFRGSAKTVNGEAVITLPGYFSRITECENMTVQLTPNGTWGQLYVAEKTPERLVIRVADGAKEVNFDFLVQGIRKGYANYQVERENDLPNQ